MGEALLRTELAGLPVRRGKVRDVYDLGGDRLLFVATDRISAFDWVMPDGVPDKGRVLNGISAFWFEKSRAERWVDAPDHVISTRIEDAGLDLDRATLDALDGRSMIVRKTSVVPFECVVRGYLSGSGWKEYRAGGAVCGHALPPGLVESQRIPTIFTPATKAESGHDINVSPAAMAESIGAELTARLEQLSVAVYERAAAFAATRGLILADTKFEWGRDPSTGGLVLIDEILTPDSSRYWPADLYRPGGPQPSFDKQFVRDWLEATGWDKASPPPSLPPDVVAKTRAKYVEAYETLTGRAFAWS